MKNVRAIVIIVIALTIAVAAVLFAQQWLKEQQGLATREVVVAKSNIDIGSRLNPELLATVNWPAGSVPEGAYLKENMGELLKDTESQQPRVVKTSLQRGEPILVSKLAPSGEKAGLTAVIPQGKRAMTVSVNEIVGVAGFTLPGSYVDIIVNTTDEQQQGKQLSRIVLEHILVLAVAQQKSRDETEPKRVSSVTLEVTPEEAEKIDLARSIGSLTLVLRSQVDKDLVVTKGATKQALLKFTPSEVKPATTTEAPKVVEKKVIVRVPARPKAKRGEEVEIIKGIDKSAQEFRANEGTQ